MRLGERLLFYTIKVVRKIHTESSRKGRDIVRLGEDMDYMERLHAETYFLGMSHILDTPALKSDTRKTGLFSLLENQWD